MFGDGKWRMIDSLGSSALIGGGEKERGGRNAGTVRIALSKNSEIRAGSRRGFPPACTPTRLSPPRSAFFGSFEVGNQLDCLSTPEKSPCTLPSVHSFSCSHTLSLSLSLFLPLPLSIAPSHTATRQRCSSFIPSTPRAPPRRSCALSPHGAASILLPSPFSLFLPPSSASPPYPAPCLLYPSFLFFFSRLISSW